MNKLFIQKRSFQTKFIYNLEAPAGPEKATPNPSTPVESVKDFIARHTVDTNRLVSDIPVSPAIKDLCHDKIGDLIISCADPEYQTTQEGVAKQMGEVLNEGETAQAPVQSPAQPKPQTSPEETQATEAATEEALTSYLNQVHEVLTAQSKVIMQEAIASDDPEKKAYSRSAERRASLMGALATNIEQNGIAWENDTAFGGDSQEVASEAEGNVGTQEGSEASNLVGLDTANIPWCGAFVKTMCEKSGNTLPEGPNWNVAETYVSENGQTGEHVAIYCGGGEMVGGNQGNAVTKCPLPGNFRFNTVENLMAGTHTDLSGKQEPEPGDIIVTNRAAAENKAGPA